MSHRYKRKAKHYHAFTFRLTEKMYYFLLRYGVLVLTVLAAYLVYKLSANHNLAYALAIQRGLELAGEAGADCFEEGVQ
jgi:hypothetical protein